MNFGADFARLAFDMYFLNVLHVCEDVRGVCNVYVNKNAHMLSTIY